MATKVGQELVEFSFNQAKTDLGNGVYGFDPKNLDNFTKTIETYEREFKRVFGSLVTTVAQIDQVTGQAVRKVYIPKEYEQEALGVRRAVDLQEFGKQGLNSNRAKNLLYQTQDTAHFLETTREIKGAKAQQFAKEAVIDVGGKIIHTAGTANKDMMTTFIPVSDAQLNNMSKKDITAFVKNVTPDSNSASRAEQADRTRKEKEAQMERDAQRQRQHFKDIKRQNEAQRKADERKQRQEAREAEREEKEKIASRKQTLGRIGKAITLLGIIADITRRILTSVMNFASETSKQQTKANTLNVGLQDVRGFNYLDKALGLDAGTQLQGQEDLRSKFGNTAKLDTEALKWLAMVMGDKVGQMVQSGIGGENPAYLMEQILDDFFKQQQEGKDQYGNYVGQDKARRALVTLLESVSPAIARTFERMIEEQSSGIHAGEITSYRQLQAFYLPSAGNVSTAEWDLLALLGKETDELKAKFSNLGELIKGNFTLALQDVISAVNNLHIGMNEEEAFQSNIADYEKLTEWSKMYLDTKNSASERLKTFLTEQGAMSGKMTIEDVIMYAGYDTAGTEGEERAKIQNARSAIEAIYKNPSLYNDLLMYYTSGDLIEAIEKETRKSNPNADPAKYGEASLPLAKRYAETRYLAQLGFLQNNELAFTDSLFTRGIGAGDLRYADVIESKQHYFSAGAEEFFGLAQAMGANSKYGRALKDVLTQYNKRYNTNYGVTAVLDAVGSDSPYWQGVLKDLFTFGTIYSGLKADTRTLMQNYAMYLPDEYGLTQSEWGSVYDKIYSVLDKRKYKGYELTSVNVGQGSSAGTIDINVNLKDEKGRVTSVKETVKGTMEGNVKLDRNMELIND